MLERFVQRFFREGALIIRLPDREILAGRPEPGTPPPIVRVRDYGTAARIARNPHLALGEAYMDGAIVMERGDIYDLLENAARNFRSDRKTDLWSKFKRGLAKMVSNANARAAARRNVAHHYDLSVELYRRFLDADMQYSCAYFTHEGASLEEAQLAKKRHIAAKLILKPGQKVLDIGCGWGGMALTLAEEYGVDVLGVTLSIEQLTLASQRAEERGLSGRVRFELQDYRDVAGPFDRVVSVGMFEHVGVRNYDAYFHGVRRLLKEDGVALIHTIGRLDGPNVTSPWTAKYIFPGGYIPALSEVAPAIERAGLVLTDIEVLRLHYAETLHAWRERFLAHRAEIAAFYDERFCRMWEFYLAGSEASFRYGASVVFQFQLAKKHGIVPITRDYVTAADRASAMRGAGQMV